MNYGMTKGDVQRYSEIYEKYFRKKIDPEDAERHLVIMLDTLDALMNNPDHNNVKDNEYEPTKQWKSKSN